MPKTKKESDTPPKPVIGVFQDSKAITMRLPKEMEKHVLRQPNRSAWLREAVREKMERERLEKMIKRRRKLLSMPSLTTRQEMELKRLNVELSGHPFVESPEDAKAMEIIRKAAKVLEVKA